MTVKPAKRQNVRPLKPVPQPPPFIEVAQCTMEEEARGQLEFENRPPSIMDKLRAPPPLLCLIVKYCVT